MASPMACRAARAILVAMLVALTIGCDRTSPAPATGARLVVLSPALAVSIRDMGGEPIVVGRHGFDMVLDPGLPACGDQTGINYEALLRVNPTDIILEWGGRELPPRLVELARDRRWGIHPFHQTSLGEFEGECRRLHDALWLIQRRAGVADDGDDLPPPWEQSPVHQRLSAALAPRPGLEHAGRILLLESTERPAALCPGSFHHDILLRIGATPAILEGAAWMPLSKEDLARLAPDGVILFEPRSPGAPAAEAHRTPRTIADLGIPAVEHGRVAVIDDPLGLLPATSLAGVAEELARIIDGWAEVASAREPDVPPR